MSSFPSRWNKDVRGVEEGVRGGVIPLREVLTGLKRQWRRNAAVREGLSLPEALASVLDPRHASAVGFGGLRSGVLTLTVDSAALFGELQGFRRAELLAAVQATPEGGRVRDLRFVAAEAGHG